MKRSLTHTAIVLLGIALALPAWTSRAHPQDLKPESFAGRDSMNGLKLSDYAGFERDWRLVTVRYRKDTGEMRWTFANELAWKTLQAGMTHYPDGAVFAKIGIATHEDSQFPSSMVPSGARRYQLMVRDARKFKETGGWGYAIFDVNGKTFPEDPAKTSKACWACHTIVQNRGQVFSQPFQLSPFVKASFISSGKGFRSLHFKWTETTRLSGDLRKYFQAETKRIRVITDAFLRENLFQGTLDEIRPSLETEASENGAPAALFSSDKNRYSIVIPISKNGCKPGQAFRSITSMTGTQPPRESEYCNP